jgi:PAS domain S-box-containing protein
MIPLGGTMMPAAPSAGDDRPRHALPDAHTLVEHYLDGVVLVVGDRVRYANRALEEMTGYTVEEILGNPAVELLVPADRERATQRMRELYEGGPEYPSRYLLHRRDGGQRAVEVLCRVVEHEGEPALISMIWDITERETAEARLRESEERYRALYEDNPSMYFTVDQDGRVLSVNKFGAEQLGYRPAELVRQDVLQVFHEDDRQAVRRQLAECLANRARVSSWELRKVRKDGSVVWVRERARTVAGADGKPMVLIVCEDITAQKLAAEERRHLEDQVRHAQKLESLGLMAGGIAHDFNNLLVGILGSASHALSKLEAESPARSDLQHLEKAADRAAELCKQLLAYSGRGRFEVRPLDVSDLVRDLADLLSVAVPRKGLLRYDLAPDLPSIEADAAQIRQIVMNLVTNAAEAIGASSGTITVTTRVMNVERDIEDAIVGKVAAGRYTCLEVADTGCGMNDQTLKRIFDPFFTTKFTGRGLGLAAVLGIVRGHSGAIDVWSEPGRGTTFRALFPCSDSVRRSPARVVRQQSADRGSGTVLVVDDEPIVRAMAEQTLSHSGYNVLTAEDGEQGVQRFRAHEGEIALVLLDVTMPGIGGEEALRALREIRGDVKILLSSGYDEQEVTSRFTCPGPSGFIQKPYRPSELLCKVRDVLGAASGH